MQSHNAAIWAKVWSAICNLLYRLIGLIIEMETQDLESHSTAQFSIIHLIQLTAF